MSWTLRRTLGIAALTVATFGLAAAAWTAAAQSGAANSAPNNSQTQEARPSLNPSPSQSQGQSPNQPSTQPTTEPKPGDGPSKEELDAYREFMTIRGYDPMRVIELGTAFLANYPASRFVTAVHAELATVYLDQQNEDKFLEHAKKALELNPDDIDVLPLLAMYIPRRVKMNTPDAVHQLDLGRGYAQHGIDVLNALAKPAQLDDVQFQKIKNDKLALCHSGLGAADIKQGDYPGAVAELKQATELAAIPDPVDFFLLGAADNATNHFTNAIAAYNQCATSGPLQAQCKAGIEKAKKDSQTKPEATE
jgi:tetratricopeptide (TPR) repeat protein